MAGVSSILEFLSILIFSRSGFNTIPAGPFAIIFAIVYRSPLPLPPSPLANPFWNRYQSHRLVPSLYSFELFHPFLLLNNRYPLYILCLLLLTSQPPASLILSSCGLISSIIYSSTLPSTLQNFRIPLKAYDIFGKVFSPLTGTNRPFRRGTVVTFEEGLLQALGGVGAEQLLGTITTGPRGGRAQGDLLNVGNGNAVRRRSAVRQPDRSPTSALATRPVERTAPAPPPPRATQRLPQIPGTSFLGQWQAGLSGGSTGPSNE